jgi:hypothetical protein
MMVSSPPTLDHFPAADDALPHIRPQALRPQWRPIQIAKCERLISASDLASNHRVMTLIRHRRSHYRNLVSFAEAYAIAVKKTARGHVHLQNSGVGFNYEVRSLIAIDRTPELLHLLNDALYLHFSRCVVSWRARFHAVAKDQNYDKNAGNHS